jgi:hypothetical protein
MKGKKIMTVKELKASGVLDLLTPYPMIRDNLTGRTISSDLFYNATHPINDCAVTEIAINDDDIDEGCVGIDVFIDNIPGGGRCLNNISCCGNDVSDAVYHIKKALSLIMSEHTNITMLIKIDMCEFYVRTTNNSSIELLDHPSVRVRVCSPRESSRGYCWYWTYHTDVGCMSFNDLSSECDGYFKTFTSIDDVIEHMMSTGRSNCHLFNKIHIISAQ